MKPFRAYANILRMRLNLALRREVIGNRPIAAYVEPTLFCNLRCPACPTGLRLDTRPRRSLPWDLFRAAIDEVGDYLFVLYLYNWGEPLLHRQTPEMVRYANRKGIRTVMSSNLSIPLGDDYLERLVRSGLDWLTVSADGFSQETYGRYRHQGNLELVRRNMLRIQELKRRFGSSTPHVKWQFLVFRHNEHEIESVRRSYRDWGADSVIFGGGYLPSPEFLTTLEPSSLQEFNVLDPQHPEQREARRQIVRGGTCSWLYSILVLNPDGLVSPCCAVSSAADDFARYRPREGVSRAWNSERFRTARRWLSAGRRQSVATRTDRSAPEPIIPLGGLPRPTARQNLKSLVCKRCPIPNRQNEAEQLLPHIVNSLEGEFRRQSTARERIRVLIKYLMMGAPGLEWRRWWRALRTVKTVRVFPERISGAVQKEADLSVAYRS